MKESRWIEQKIVDAATVNFVNRQAQEAILDPNLPEVYKDQIVDAAVATITKVAEKRKHYTARQRGRKHGKYGERKT